MSSYVILDVQSHQDFIQESRMSFKGKKMIQTTKKWVKTKHLPGDPIKNIPIFENLG